MSQHISEIELTGDLFNPYEVGPSAKRLSHLSQINLFVGANNSGKSRFLRALASIQKLTFVPGEDFQPVRDLLVSINTKLIQVCKSANVDYIKNLVADSAAMHTNYIVYEKEDPLASLKTLIQSTQNIPLHSLGTGPELLNVTRPFQETLDNISPTLSSVYNFKRVYIPTLRGLRPFDSDDAYAKRTQADYFSKAQHVEVFTGLNLYQELRRLLLGSFKERQAAAEFERFLSEAFFESQQVTLIPKEGQNALDVKIGNEHQRPIFDLGDGIQSTIVLTFPLFRNKGEKLLLFIEEPELFMHPGMQRVFLNVLRRKEFKDAQYFMATHSNHLLDLTLDVESVSVFTFRKDFVGEDSFERPVKITVENVSNEDERSLQLLGIQNSSVFLSNCTVWVEGITDRRYLSRYLHLYQDHLKRQAEESGSTLPKCYRQDIHYSFVEYAGANITHYSFLDNEDDAIVVERLCAKLFLVTDKDSESSPAKIERRRKLTERLGERYCCLRCREIENLLTPGVIEAIVRYYEGDDMALKEFIQSDYEAEPLGTFIEDKVLSIKRKHIYAAESGAVRDKVMFCQRALEHIADFEDLSPEAKELAERLYNFIASQNR